MRQHSWFSSQRRSWSEAAHPTVLGQGRPLFDGQARVDCDLLELAEHEDGVTMQPYAVRQPR